MSKTISIDQIEDYLGKEVGVTDWFEIDQDRVNKFADVTEDHQYIHIDEERAAQTPFGTTIVHGFLTLSLISMFKGNNGGINLENAAMTINYGLDKVRFINPVKVGSKVRARFQLVSCDEKNPNQYLMKHNVTVEIEGEDKPALIAEWLGMSVIN